MHLGLCRMWACGLSLRAGHHLRHRQAQLPTPYGALDNLGFASGEPRLARILEVCVGHRPRTWQGGVHWGCHGGRRVGQSL